MGDEIGQSDHHDHRKVLIKSALVRVPLRIITITLLSLLLPLAFLLLARIACTRFLLSQLLKESEISSSPAFFSVFLHTNPAILYIIVSTVSIVTLVHTLTGKLTLLSESHYVWSPLTLRPRLFAAWIFLCTLQVCVGLGIEGTVALDADFSSFGTDRTLFSRVIFFLGLHETMLHWSRLVVKPVVDDTIFGVVSRNEKWVVRGAMAASFGSLWYWRLRDEVESLVVVAEAKGEMLMEVGMADFAGWWLYYLTVTIGMVKVVKGLMWVGMSLFCRRVGGISSDDPNTTTTLDIGEDKV
ncbi:Transmembrane protein [Trema orientale]|uniref:Transmembrane protein n=1 Tax=Trema orientale TaxID=63057 RepID=A0A2P5DGE2_TREOI|nr:Transmembrane protein [Trema orientale]